MKTVDVKAVLVRNMQEILTVVQEILTGVQETLTGVQETLTGVRDSNSGTRLTLHHRAKLPWATRYYVDM